MKLNLGKKENTSIQEKVKNILALDLNNYNQNETKGKNEMKLNLKKTETTIPAKLQLNKSKIEFESNLTIDKFDRIEKLSNKIFDLDKSFIEFINNQKEKNSFFNQLDKKIDNLEILVLNSIKNQKSILDSINSFHAKAFQTETKPAAAETKPAAAETKLIKAIDRLSIDNPESLYKYFMQKFEGNFCGTKEMDYLEQFIEMVNCIEFDNIDTIDKSFKVYFSDYLKANENSQPVARKSIGKAKVALLELSKALNLNSDTVESKIPIVIDKAYFANLYDTDINTISELIEEIKQYGKIDNTSSNEICDYLNQLNCDIENHLEFIKYCRSYLNSNK